MSRRKQEYLERFKEADANLKIKMLTGLSKYGVIAEKEITSFSNLETMAKVLEEEYPNNWDIVLSTNRYKAAPFPKTFKKGDRSIHYKVIIRFPKVSMSNSTGARHTIEDLFVMLSLREGGRFLTPELFGLRMAATPAEIVSRYQHSHLPSRDYKVSGENAFDFRTFCLGSSEVNQVLAMLVGNFTEDLFRLLLFQLKEYVNWESIEGTPYTYFRGVIGAGSVYNITNSFIVKWTETILEYRRGTPSEIDFGLSPGGVKVIDNEKFENFLKIYPTRDSYPAKALIQKDVQGNEYGLRVETPSLSNYMSSEEELKKIEFTFRKEIVKFRVLPEVQENKEFYLHKKIKNYVKSRIEEKINNQRLRSHITKQLSSLKDIQRNTEQNRLFMPTDS